MFSSINFTFKHWVLACAVTCALLFCLLVSVLYSGVNNVKKSSISVNEKISQIGGQKNFNTIDMQYSLRRINSSNIFKVKDIKTKATVKANKTKLKLKLEGVIAAGDSNLSKAIIQTNKNKPFTYSLGDKIEGTNATLDSVESDRVLIERAGVIESLELSRKIIKHQSK